MYACTLVSIHNIDQGRILKLKLEWATVHVSVVKAALQSIDQSLLY